MIFKLNYFRSIFADFGFKSALGAALLFVVVSCLSLSSSSAFADSSGSSDCWNETFDIWLTTAPDCSETPNAGNDEAAMVECSKACNRSWCFYDNVVYTMCRADRELSLIHI